MGASRIFVDDLKQALRAWKKDPRLPILSLWLYILVSLPSFIGVSAPAWLTIALLPLSFLTVGYVGTERIWYLRLWRGQTLGAVEILNFSWWLLGRFFALGVLISIPFFPLFFLIGTDAGMTRYWIASAIVGVLTDFAITFATPSLAYSTPSAREALVKSLKMIREHWPRSAYFALVPPAAALVTLRFLPGDTLALPVHIGLTAGGALLNLLFKGATAAFYLRFHPDVPDDGAAHLRPPRDHVELPR